MLHIWSHQAVFIECNHCESMWVSQFVCFLNYHSKGIRLMVFKCNDYTSDISEVKQQSALGVWCIRNTKDTAAYCVPFKKKKWWKWNFVYLIFFSVKVCFQKVGENLAIKLKFTIQSEMRSRWGRGAKLFKTNVYLEKWALSMGLPVLPECCSTNVFTRPEQTTSRTSCSSSSLQQQHPGGVAFLKHAGPHSEQDTVSH